MGIAREQIIDAAIRLIDEAGLDQLTTRKIAERLKVQQPALYWHFRSKRDLLDAVNARIIELGHDRRSPLPGEDWRQFSRAYARSLRRALLAHRDAARIQAAARPVPADLASYEAQLELFVAGGFPLELALQANLAVARFVIGSVVEEQADDMSDDGDPPLSELEGYPMLLEAVRSQMTGEHHKGHEHAFEAGLDLLITGLETKLAAAGGNTGLPRRDPPRPRQRARRER